MRRKKLLSLMLCAAMAGTLLAGCGGGTAENTGSSAATQAGESKADAADKADDAETKDTEGSSAAEGGSGESVVTEPTELTFIFADGDEGAKPSMNEIVNRFNDACPDITVRIEPGNGGAYSEFLKTKESVGEFPDVMEMRDTAVYYRRGC